MLKKAIHKLSLAKFFKIEAASGIILIIATILALLIANSQNYQIYQNFLAIKMPINLDFIAIKKDLSLLDWINDFLMAIFFFLIGLELKKEFLIGELANFKRAVLPIIAAVGGVLFPALIFYYFNHHNDNLLKGIAIPTATDIAFAFAIICLFGKNIAPATRIFVISLAIIDDLIAILIIAFFYNKNINLTFLLLALMPIVILTINHFYYKFNYAFFILNAIFLWLFILKSGIHPTIAGVILAIFVPFKEVARCKEDDKTTVNYLENIAHKIAPIVNFLILPLFAFANSAIRFNEINAEIVNHNLFKGVFFGLFIGKQCGIMIFSIIAIKLKIAKLPRNSDWLEFYGVAIIAGIGFTMSLFIDNLAFYDNYHNFEIAKIAIFIASLTSAIIGSIILFIANLKTIK